MKTALLTFAIAALASAQPKLTNARLETRPAGGNLESEVRSLVNQQGPVWIGHSVPIAGEHRSC